MINKELYFESLHLFWKYAMQDSSAYKKDSRSLHNNQWAGGVTWEQAKELALKGWREGITEIEKYRANTFPLIANKVLKAKLVYAQCGYNVDIGRFLSNDPECFRAHAFEETAFMGRIYKIVCSISFSAAIQPATIIQRGAMIGALIDAIEYAGHRVEVVCNWSVSANHEDEFRKGFFKTYGWLEISVVIKKANQALEMSDLAYCLAHPSMLRRIMFSVAEIEGWSNAVQNYGYPAEATDKGDIYIQEVFSGNVSDEQTIDWVLEQLKKLEINIETD